MEIIVTSKESLQEILEQTIKKVDSENRKKENSKLMTVNQVAIRLGKAHATIKKLIAQGYIQTTKSGLISEDAINEYLGNQ